MRLRGEYDIIKDEMSDFFSTQKKFFLSEIESKNKNNKEENEKEGFQENINKIILENNNINENQKNKKKKKKKNCFSLNYFLLKKRIILLNKI